MTNEEAYKQIQGLVQQAEGLISQAESVADMHGLEFSIDIGGYGMGGWYSSGEWMASSQSC